MKKNQKFYDRLKSFWIKEVDKMINAIPETMRGNHLDLIIEKDIAIMLGFKTMDKYKGFTIVVPNEGLIKKQMMYVVNHIFFE